MAGAIYDRASANSRAFRAVFVDAGIHYVDERGEHSGLVSEHVSAEEDRCRLGVVSNTEPWLRTAIALGDELLSFARRVGEVDSWGCTSGRYGGANPGPNLAARTIKTITGRRPPKPASGPFARPGEGRWSVRQVFDYERGNDAPTVAVWHLGFTQDPQFWPAWCDAISNGVNAPTLIVPDSPITRQMVDDWNAGRLTPGRRGWTGDRIKDYPGSVAYVRPRVSAVLEPDGTLSDGGPLISAMDFLRARHQLRISPFDLLCDPLMRSQLAPITIADPEWSKAEVAQLGKLRERYARVQQIHAWIEEARMTPPRRGHRLTCRHRPPSSRGGVAAAGGTGYDGRQLAAQAGEVAGGSCQLPPGCQLAITARGACPPTGTSSPMRRRGARSQPRVLPVLPKGPQPPRDLARSTVARRAPPQPALPRTAGRRRTPIRATLQRRARGAASPGHAQQRGHADRGSRILTKMAAFWTNLAARRGN